MGMFTCLKDKRVMVDISIMIMGDTSDIKRYYRGTSELAV